MSPPLGRVVVVGASLAGVAAVEELRLRGFSGEVALVGAEQHLPYDRPPLSKQLLAGTAQPTDCYLRPLGWTDELGVELHLGAPAVALDTAERKLRLERGGTLSYDGLVIATGATPRLLSGGLAPDLHTLRTVEDALALRAQLERGERLAIVGGGFIGAEVASTARGYGVEVTLIEALPSPLSRVLGTTIGDLCGRLHTGHGVQLRCGSAVRGITSARNARTIHLEDGSSVVAEAVLLGLGVAPNTEWLASSGLDLDNGVMCDACCRTSVAGVVAAGDVARWRHPRLGSVRIEHWENAVSQGQAAARALLDPDDPTPYAPVPYVWSDQYDCKIQVVGIPTPEDELVIVDGEPGTFAFAALYGRDDRLTAGLAFNRRSAIRRTRKLLASDVSFHDAVAEFAHITTAA